MEDTKLLNPWALGGDARQGWAVKALRNSGLPMKAWGVPGMNDDTKDLEAALRAADLVLLPRSPFSGEMLKIGETSLVAALLPQMLPKGASLIAGEFPEELEHWLSTQGVRCMGYQELESYQIANAAVTAEGAIMLAMESLNRTIAGAEILVVGWGRIGKFLAEKLKGLDAAVTVSARREAHWAEIEALGMRPEETGVYHHGLGEYDMVMSTVPAPVFTKAQGEELREDCRLMELASLPGGFTEVKGKTIIMAQGLPGKTAPKTAGENLAAAVWACIAGEGRTME